MHNAMSRLPALLVMLTSAAHAQTPARPPGGTYKVAFWYESARPVVSIKYQAYDLSKGQYDEKAVDRWYHAILEHHPGHGAYVREIRTAGLPGATEPERLATAIEDEKGRWAALQRMASPPWPGRYGSSTPEGRTSFRRASPMGLGNPGRPVAPGSPGVYRDRPSSPFPYPYRSGPR